MPVNVGSYVNCSQSGTGASKGNAADITSTTYGIQPSSDNNDGNNTPDYLDNNADGDAYPDWIEGFDHIGSYGSANGSALDFYYDIADAYEANNGNPGHYDNTIDTDSDGIPDWLDNLASTPSGPKHDISNPPFQTFGNAFFRDSDSDGIVDLFDADAGGKSQSNTTRPDIDGDSDFDWRDFDSVIDLPIELIKFTAKKHSNSVLLNWITQTEINNSHFNIERSTDGLTFETIGTIQGAGTTNEIQNYIFEDKSPAQGVNYYRLKQVDFDEQNDYSNTIVITIEQTSATKISAWPNPAKENLNLSIEQIEAGSQLQIINSVGQVVFEKQYTISTSNLTDQINIEHLNSGIYYCQLKSGKQKLQLKFIVRP